MKKILNIISSVKGDTSFSIKLSNAIIEKIKAEHPDSEVITRDLAKNPFPHLEEVHYTSFNTPEEAHTPAHKEAIKHSNAAIKEVKDADFIVIGVPLYNFGIPSTLKSWVDHVARAGVTFSYAKGYPEGMVLGKKVFLAIASGAVYSEGAYKAYDYTENYLRTILGFLGMTDVTVFRVEGIAMPDGANTALPKAVESVNAFAF